MKHYNTRALVGPSLELAPGRDWENPTTLDQLVIKPSAQDPSQNFDGATASLDPSLGSAPPVLEKYPLGVSPDHQPKTSAKLP